MGFYLSCFSVHCCVEDRVGDKDGSRPTSYEAVMVNFMCQLE